MKYNKGFLKFAATKDKIRLVANKFYHQHKKSGRPSSGVGVYNKQGGVICIVKPRYMFGEMMDIFLSDGKTKVGEVFALKGRINFN